MDRSSKQKINKEIQVLNDTLDEMDLIDIFRVFHPNAEEYTFFSSAHGTFSRIDHILGHNSNLSKFKKMCTPMADSCLWMTKKKKKKIQYYKVISLQLKQIN